MINKIYYNNVIILADRAATLYLCLDFMDIPDSF